MFTSQIVHDQTCSVVVIFETYLEARQMKLSVLKSKWLFYGFLREMKKKMLLPYENVAIFNEFLKPTSI